MRCPKCKAKNSNNAEHCYSCQTKLTKKIHSSYKKCPKCGKKYSYDLKYCIKCQCELIEKTKSNLPIIVVSSTSALVLIILSVVRVSVVYPGYMFNKAIDGSDSKQLVSVCMKYPNLLDNSDKTEKYNLFIEKRVTDYISDLINYDEVVIDFENFDIINSHLIDDVTLKNTNDKRKKIEEFHMSRLAFEEAEEAFTENKYQTAEEKYSVIIEQDEEYYLSSQDKLKKINELKSAYIQQSNEKISSNDYDGSIKILTEGIANFGYDEDYSNKYYNLIVDTISKESDYLMKKGLYFSYNNQKGAFNLVYSYLNEEKYANSDILKSKLIEIASESESSEIDNAEKNLGLINKNKVLDRVADKAAKDYCNNHSIQDNNSYIISVCKEDDGIQGLLADIPKEKQISVALISDISVTSEDFSKVCSEKLELYSDYVWDYTGIGRYYDEENKVFSWAVIIIYETEQ